jgi:hypothetical protein
MKPNLREEHEKRHLDALLARLRARAPGGTYPLDPYERDLLLREIERLRILDGNED